MEDFGHYDPSQILGNEKATLRALSLSVIRFTVDEHQGQLTNEQCTECIDIDVPEGEEALCAERIGEKMGLICHHMYAHVDALFKGEVLIQFADN